MTPPSLTPPVKPKPAKPIAPASAQTGVDDTPSLTPTPHAVPRPVLDPDGSYAFIYTINPQETRRLLTRTGRATREEMEKELPRYVERIVKRAVESEIY